METTIIGLASTKGGVGKTTVATVIANRLAYVHNKKVLVIDTDPMSPIINRREEDLEEFGDELKKDPYDVIEIESESLSDMINAFIGQYDYVVIDFPGAIRQAGVKGSLIFCDYIFVPTDVSPTDWNGTVQFIEMLHEEITPKKKQILGDDAYIEIYGIFTKIMKNQKEFKEHNSPEGRKELPAEFLQEHFPYMLDVFKRNFNTVADYQDNHNKPLKVIDELENLLID